MADRAKALDLEQLLQDRGAYLMRAAFALTGSRPAAEDLLQAALERALASPRTAVIDPERYLRRTLYNLAADGWRRRGRWLARVPLLAMQHDHAHDGTAVVDLRDALVRALRQLPPRQRAVIVLRYWEQLTETEAAELLGCTVGTVKSTTSKGLHRLRELAASWNSEDSRLTEERS